MFCVFDIQIIPVPNRLTGAISKLRFSPSEVSGGLKPYLDAFRELCVLLLDTLVDRGDPHPTSLTPNFGIWEITPSA